MLQEKRQERRDGEKESNDNSDIEQDLFSAPFDVESAALSSAKSTPRLPPSDL